MSFAIIGPLFIALACLACKGADKPQTPAAPATPPAVTAMPGAPAAPTAPAPAAASAVAPAAAPADVPVATWLGTFGKSPTGECFDVEVKNGAPKGFTSTNVALYAYDAAGNQIGEKYEYVSIGLTYVVKPGDTLKQCIANKTWFKGEIASAEAVAYSASFEDKTNWFRNLAPKKAKGAPAFQ